MTSTPTNPNPALFDTLTGYDATGHQINIALQVGTVTQDATTGVWYAPLAITGSISATNPSVGTDGQAIPASSTLIGASDGTNLQQLLVESASNRNLRVGLYNGANEWGIDGSGKGPVKAAAGDFADMATVAGAISGGKMQSNVAQWGGQPPTLDNTSIPAFSMRGKGAGTAGDTPLLLDSSGRPLIGNIVQIGGQNVLVETTGALAGALVLEDLIRNLTLSGKAYSVTTGKLSAPSATTLGFQLFNPASSGKSLLIYSLILNVAAATFHDFRMTTADVSSITGWTNAALTPVNNKGGGAASAATAGSSNTSLTGGLLGTSREIVGVSATQSQEALTNGDVVYLPSAASINGIAVYITTSGTNNWSVTAKYLEF